MTQFQKKILDWYREHGRHDLPWRLTTNPYAIFVSELMLQQTQVERVLPKYNSFLKKFPTVKTLATAHSAELLRAWQGLGYNRRALYLQQTAKQITNNTWPTEPAHLEQFPGIGPYTARAIAVFAFNRPEQLLETNIRRVFIQSFFTQTQGLITDADILPLLQKHLYTKDPRRWYWALMDYGAGALKHIPNPNRRSTTYTRQSRFEGSHRQIRGRILRLLIDKESATMKNIQDGLNVTTDRLIKALDELTRERFLAKKGTNYRLYSQ